MKKTTTKKRRHTNTGVALNLNPELFYEAKRLAKILGVTLRSYALDCVESDWPGVVVKGR